MDAKIKGAVTAGPWPRVFCALAIGALVVVPGTEWAFAKRAGHGAKDYAACLALTRTDPDQALERARKLWRGGAEAASRHCVALALMAKGRYLEAARTLEGLAEPGNGSMVNLMGVNLMGEILAQAGQAWLMAGEGKRAIAAFTAAMAKQPGDVELLVDRAIAYGNEGRYSEAVDDLNRAIGKGLNRANAYLLRANAHRRLGSLALATEDVGRALALRPRSGEALLERGIIHRLQNHIDAARRDWTQVLRVAPDSPADTAAQRNLQMLAPQGK